MVSVWARMVSERRLQALPGERSSRLCLEVALEAQRLFSVRIGNGRLQTPRTVLRRVRIASGVVLRDPTFKILSETNVEMRRFAHRPEDIHVEVSGFHAWRADSSHHRFQSSLACRLAKPSEQVPSMTGAPSRSEPAKQLWLPVFPLRFASGFDAAVFARLPAREDWSGRRDLNSRLLGPESSGRRSHLPVVRRES